MHKNSGKTLTRLPDDGTLFLCNRKSYEEDYYIYI